MTAPTIPPGFKPWHGGDSAPADWDGGEVYTHDSSEDAGEVYSLAPSFFGEGDECWQRDNTFVDIIAYTPTTPIADDEPHPHPVGRMHALGTTEPAVADAVMDGAGLKACPNPWCSTARDRTAPGPHVKYYSSSCHYRVRCSVCPQIGPAGDTEAEAIAAWNHRPTPTPPQGFDAAAVREAITGEALFRAFMVGDTNRLTTTALPTDWPGMKPLWRQAWKVYAAAIRQGALPGEGEA